MKTTKSQFFNMQIKLSCKITENRKLAFIQFYCMLNALQNII